MTSARINSTGKDVKSKEGLFENRTNSISNDMELDVKLELIKELIPLGLLYVEEVLQDEVEQLAGGRYKRGGKSGYDRWGYQRGSVYVGDQKLSIKYPRVRDTVENKEVPLSSYKGLQEPKGADEKLLMRVLHGLSCRRYRECSEMVPEVFGMSSSTISRRFIKASENKLRQLQARRLDGYDFVCILIDGKTFDDDEMIIAVGITLDGEKVILGFVQSGTENGFVCKEFLGDLVERGLRIDNGILCIIDGSKGLRKGVEKAFGRYALVQRCQWHKRENVVSHLPKSKQLSMRKKLQSAYEERRYKDAKRELLRIKQELAVMNKSAVRSLEEGFEETLTLHRLGLFEKLGISLKTTNCIESIMAQIGQKIDKVDYWKNPNQKHRWLAAALLDSEPRMNRIKGHIYLKELSDAIQNEIGINIRKKVA